MTKDLTTSNIARQNILNNGYALEKVEEQLDLGGTYYNNEKIFTKAQIAMLLDIDERTIERYLSSNEKELNSNGYRVIRGSELREVKLAFGSDINVGTKTTVLGVFTFRALLNLAMLITESQQAKKIRNAMLNIVIDVVAQKAGGHTRFINQRDQDYLATAIEDHNYRKSFTDALDHYLDMGKFKYGVYTDKIYKAIFLENANEYKQILKLRAKDKTRDTMYTEVLRAIASFENGLAVEMKTNSENLGRKLKPKELDTLLNTAANSPFLKPVIEDARIRMASRDLCFRDALHHKLEAYVQSVPKADFEKFLGETSKSLEEQLSDSETLAVLKRLKDR